MTKPRGVIIAGNWKMNHGPKETVRFFETLSLPRHPKLKTLLFPPAVSFGPALMHANPSGVRIGAQNAHHELSGAFTGELSGPMLSEVGIQDVLVGHSERRQFFGETDESAGLRVEGLLRQGLHVMLCVGELRSERESGQTLSVLHRQLAGGLRSGVSESLDGRLSIAYEPVWAIGTGLVATTEQAEEAHQMIRKWIWDRFGMEAAGRTPILYGGSVKPDNIDALLQCPNIDGALVGGASLKADSFAALVAAGVKALRTS